MTLADIVIVLSRPQDSGNVGATCRALKNSGLSRLRIVDQDVLDDNVVRTRAVHAADVWDAAQHYHDLPSAVMDCAVVVGTTRRRGHKRKAMVMDPAELAGYLPHRSGAAALVFGNERTGLEDAELACCNLASFIPSSPAFPSLNLSHAVQIYGYELFRALSEQPVTAGHILLDQQAVAGLVEQITDSLALLGFYQQPGRQEQEQFLQDVLSRAGLQEREGKYLRDIFVKAAHLGRR
jgi:tRNA/rRNA methyltransferase/tRNA (cytidine32/uridine32-2'-O)-methyltransferase